MDNYRYDIDYLKGIAIIAILLFHLGLLKSGYLGVDVFFVINGFFVVSSLERDILKGNDSFFKYIEKKLLRLLPLIVIASLVCIFLGFFLMLPDHYENLVQSIIAGNLMSENILANLTTKNYWDVVNEYKPLMHLWYVGVLFEFYLILPVIILIGKIFAREKRDLIIFFEAVLLLLVVVSLLFYLLPYGAESNKFYYLHYRFFELGIGALIGVVVNRKQVKYTSFPLKVIALCLLLIFLLSGFSPVIDGTFNQQFVIGSNAEIAKTGSLFPKKLLLIGTVFLTGINIIINPPKGYAREKGVVASIGKMSYSIFIWHQVFLAFYRYSLGNEITIWVIPIVLLFCLTTYLSYKYVERGMINSRKNLVIWCIGSILVIAVSWFIYQRAGVVRDVPELDVTVKEAHRGMFGEYCDRLFAYNQGFNDDSDKIKVIVVGVSFGRDFGNILLESDYKDKIELNYCSSFEDARLKEWIKKCDVLFSFSDKNDVPRFVWDNIQNTASVWGIGTKSYGDCNGPIYCQRFKPDYTNLTVYPSPGYIELNNEWSKHWGNHYIDLMAPVLQDDGKVKVFTEEGKLISQDCRHLTPAGARFYAGVIDWDSIFNSE